MIASILLVVRLALAALLYIFLLTAFWALWQDIRLQQRALQMPRIPTLTLQNEKNTWRFSTPEVVIGRAPDCDCILEDNTVSARHSLITYQRGQWWLRDTGSTNGTFLNDTRLEEAAVLRDGDRMRCGQVVLRVHIHELHE